VTTPAVDDPLTDLERDVLTFERSWWKHPGAKQAAVREWFGLSSTRYHQVVNALLDRPAALVADPVLVHRLRRQRDQRRAQRARARRVVPA
jgi:hypothetical protein